MDTEYADLIHKRTAITYRIRNALRSMLSGEIRCSCGARATRLTGSSEDLRGLCATHAEARNLDLKIQRQRQEVAAMRARR